MSSLCGAPYADYGDGECDLWRERIVKVRKAHRCVECGSEIEIGEECGVASGKYHGEFSTWRRCRACLVLAEVVATISGECGLWGALLEYIEEVNDRGESDLPTPKQNRREWEAA